MPPQFPKQAEFHYNAIVKSVRAARLGIASLLGLDLKSLMANGRRRPYLARPFFLPETTLKPSQVLTYLIVRVRPESISMIEDVIKLFENNREKWFTIADISDEVGSARSNVGRVLTHLMNKDKMLEMKTLTRGGWIKKFYIYRKVNR